MAPSKDEGKLSQDTIDNLGEVKKGKPRRFVMLCKGASIVNLIVFKKGSVEKYKKEAKEAGTGLFFSGIVDGRAADIHFKLSLTEYGDKPPVKDLILKTFLEEKGEFKCKPSIDMVESVGVVLDEDDAEVKRFQKLQELALATCDKRPDVAPDINRLCMTIGTLFTNEKRDEAIAKLVELEQLLGKLNAPTAPPPPQPKPDVPTGNADKDLEALLKKVRPEVELMVKSGVDSAGRAKALTAIDELATNKEFPAALDAAKELLSNLGDDYRERSEEIAKRVEKLLSGSFTERAGDVEKIKTVFAFAQERGDTERYGSALVALKNVDTLLKTAESGDAPKEADVIKTGTVAARKKFVESRWQELVSKIHLEVDKLRPAIAMENPDEENPDELPNEITKYFDEFIDEFNDAIIGVGKGAEGDRAPVDAALDAIKEFRSRIDTDELVKHLFDAKEDLGVTVGVASAIHEALNDLEANLA
jgi:hypothetical protein